MAIAMTRYVNITSGVGAAESVSQRELITRCFTHNPLVPPQSFVEFTSAADVGTYFGFSSFEYARASFYFGWISKNITSPQKISFARWCDAAVAGTIFGKPAVYALGTFTPITTGSLNLTLGGFTHTLTGINLSAAGSLAAVAADMQTAIQAFTGGGADWTSATVTYDATRGCFDFVGGVVGPEALTVNVAATGIDLAPLLGWTTGAIVGQGSAIETITQTLNTSSGLSNNFGSFLFMQALSTNQIIEAATWNNGQNLLYQYLVPVQVANAATVSADIINLAGCAMTLTPLVGTEFPEMVPGMVMAATNYNARNSVQNYMFQIFALTPSVLNDADANTYDALRVNYYGQTQSAGQFINFYQRGVLTGLPQSPIDQNVYANEQWLKDAASAEIMTLLIALAQVAANSQGASQILGVLQSVINSALFNGVISVGKPLTTVQQLYIANATGDQKAWYQVQNLGFWVNVVIQPTTTNGVVTYTAVYTLIYSKDDIIRKVNGTHVLI